MNNHRWGFFSRRAEKRPTIRGIMSLCIDYVAPRCAPIAARGSYVVYQDTDQETVMSVVDISALVQYNNWANRRLLDTAAHLSADQLIGMVFHQVRAFAR